MPRKLTKLLSVFLCFLLIFQQSGLAQVAGELDLSVHFAKLSSSFIQPVTFRPLHLRYLSYDPAANNFNLLLDKGDFVKGLSPQSANPKDDKGTVPEEKLQKETKTLLSYFFIGISLPNQAFWVNLRPDAEDNIIDRELAKTDVGKIFLEADLQLKKDTANFTSPQTPEGKEYWDKLYKKAEELYGSENITIPTLTRPWIVPDEIIIRESSDNAYIYKATLKVMLEQDYLKDSSTYNFSDQRSKALNEYSSQLIRESIIPKLTKEINSSKRYAPLRQVYYSLILAQWFKQKFYGKSGTYSYLIDRHNLAGLTSKSSWSKTTYFNAYKNSFQQGEYNIKEPHSTLYGQSIRSYMSGGIAFGETVSSAIATGIVPSSISSSALNIFGAHNIERVGYGGDIENPYLITIKGAPSSLHSIDKVSYLDASSTIEQQQVLASSAGSPLHIFQEASAEEHAVLEKLISGEKVRLFHALRRGEEDFESVKKEGFFGNMVWFSALPHKNNRFCVYVEVEGLKIYNWSANGSRDVNELAKDGYDGIIMRGDSLFAAPKTNYEIIIFDGKRFKGKVYAVEESVGTAGQQTQQVQSAGSPVGQVQISVSSAVKAASSLRNVGDYVFSQDKKRVTLVAKIPGTGKQSKIEELANNKLAVDSRGGFFNVVTIEGAHDELGKPEHFVVKNEINLPLLTEYPNTRVFYTLRDNGKRSLFARDLLALMLADPAFGGYKVKIPEMRLIALRGSDEVLIATEYIEGADTLKSRLLGDKEDSLEIAQKENSALLDMFFGLLLYQDDREYLLKNNALIPFDFDTALAPLFYLITNKGMAHSYNNYGYRLRGKREEYVEAAKKIKDFMLTHKEAIRRIIEKYWAESAAHEEIKLGNNTLLSITGDMVEAFLEAQAKRLVTSVEQWTREKDARSWDDRPIADLSYVEDKLSAGSPASSPLSSSSPAIEPEKVEQMVEGYIQTARGITEFPGGLEEKPHLVLAAVLAGKKPVFLSDVDVESDDRHPVMHSLIHKAEESGLTVVKEQSLGSSLSYLVGKKQNVEAIQGLFRDAREGTMPIDEHYHRKLGQLLGYTEQSIEDFVARTKEIEELQLLIIDLAKLGYIQTSGFYIKNEPDNWQGYSYWAKNNKLIVFRKSDRQLFLIEIPPFNPYDSSKAHPVSLAQGRLVSLEDIKNLDTEEGNETIALLNKQSPDVATNGTGRVSSPATDNNISSALDKDLGGIDMRSLPKYTKIEQVSSPLKGRSLSTSGIASVSDKEWLEIERMANAGLAPSCERLREYLLSLKDPNSQIDKVLACIAGILRQEEEKACGTESSLREILVLLESGKPANELRLALAKVEVSAKEPQLIEQ